MTRCWRVAVSRCVRHRCSPWERRDAQAAPPESESGTRESVERPPDSRQRARASESDEQEWWVEPESSVAQEWWVEPRREPSVEPQLERWVEPLPESSVEPLPEPAREERSQPVQVPVRVRVRAAERRRASRTQHWGWLRRNPSAR